MRRWLPALALVISAAGCATSGSMTQAELKFLETREIDLPYQETYAAALNAMFSLGLQITHSDKSSGVISGLKRNMFRLSVCSMARQPSLRRTTWTAF